MNKYLRKVKWWLEDMWDDFGTRFAAAVGFILIVLFLFFLAFKSHAQPLAVFSDEKGVTVTLTDEDCKLKHLVQLPYRATWKEPGKVFEGCYGVRPGMIISYWEDKSIAILPMGAFRPASHV